MKSRKYNNKMKKRNIRSLRKNNRRSLRKKRINRKNKKSMRGGNGEKSQGVSSRAIQRQQVPTDECSNPNCVKAFKEQKFINPSRCINACKDCKEKKEGEGKCLIGNGEVYLLNGKCEKATEPRAEGNDNFKDCFFTGEYDQVSRVN